MLMRGKLTQGTIGLGRGEDSHRETSTSLEREREYESGSMRGKKGSRGRACLDRAAQDHHGVALGIETRAEEAFVCGAVHDLRFFPSLK